jgi:hypothetical protein
LLYLGHPQALRHTVTWWCTLLEGHLDYFASLEIVSRLLHDFRALLQQQNYVVLVLW